MAYNGPLPVENIHQIYSIEEFSEWLEDNREGGRLWFVLEDTNMLSDTNLLAEAETLLSDRNLSYSRSLLHGPQTLLVFEIDLRK